MTRMAAVIVLFVLIALVWFFVMLVIGANRLAKKSVNALNTLENMGRTPLPPPAPGTRRG